MRKFLPPPVYSKSQRGDERTSPVQSSTSTAPAATPSLSQKIQDSDAAILEFHQLTCDEQADQWDDYQ